MELLRSQDNGVRGSVRTLLPGYIADFEATLDQELARDTPHIVNINGHGADKVVEIYAAVSEGLEVFRRDVSGIHTLKQQLGQAVSAGSFLGV